MGLVPGALAKGGHAGRGRGRFGPQWRAPPHLGRHWRERGRRVRRARRRGRRRRRERGRRLLGGVVGHCRTIAFLFHGAAKKAIITATKMHRYAEPILIRAVLQGCSASSSSLPPHVSEKKSPLTLGEIIGTMATAFIATLSGYICGGTHIALCHLFFYIKGVLFLARMRLVPPGVRPTRRPERQRRGPLDGIRGAVASRPTLRGRPFGRAPRGVAPPPLGSTSPTSRCPSRTGPVASGKPGPLPRLLGALLLGLRGAAFPRGLLVRAAPRPPARPSAHLRDRRNNLRRPT